MKPAAGFLALLFASCSGSEETKDCPGATGRGDVLVFFTDDFTGKDTCIDGTVTFQPDGEVTPSLGSNGPLLCSVNVNWRRPFDAKDVTISVVAKDFQPLSATIPAGDCNALTRTLRLHLKKP